MNVKQVIETRRAYRALDPIEITEELIKDLAKSAQLAPSCFNNQPWRFVFVYAPEVLQTLKAALSTGNAWAQDVSLIIAVFSNIEKDCRIKNREYYLFDSGLATAFLILRATELGLVAHPIAGYNEEHAKKMLRIPEDMTLITLLIIGKHSKTVKPNLSDKQAATEQKRPKRLPLESFIYLNRVGTE